MKTLHIFTLNWQNKDRIIKLRETLLPALENLNYSPAWQIRDNGSTDGGLEEIKKWDDVSILETGHNRHNFSQGINSLAERVKNYTQDDDIYMLLNNDIEFNDKESINNMLQLFDDPKVSVVGARLLYKGTNKLQHAGVIFGPRYGNMPYHYRHGEESDKHAEKNREFQSVTAACALVRASDFWKVGGMNEFYNWSFDDIDLSMRICKLGKKIIYCGQTNISHEESVSLKKNPVNKLFLNQNVIQFKKDWFGKYDIDHEKYLKNYNYNLYT